MVHRYCGCNDSVGLCGKALSGRYRPGVPIDCVVCASLRDGPCPRCGTNGGSFDWSSPIDVVELAFGFWRRLLIGDR